MKIKFLVLICLMISLCACGKTQNDVSAVHDTNLASMTKDDKKFPSFKIPLEDGTSLDTTKLSKPTFINIWATWCGYCIVEMPDINELCIEYKDKVDFILLDGAEPKIMVDDFVKEKFPYHTYKVGYDEKGEIVNSLGIMGFPTTFLIKSDGTVVEQIVGARSKEVYKRSIDNLLASENGK
jgi:thiol-disulfide isomerase/thioredoxin